MVPVTIDGETVKLATITYKPDGPGPVPTLIFHHGSTGRGTDPALFDRPYDPKILADWFTERGWAVVLPSRRGRGGSEGLYDEGFALDRSIGLHLRAAPPLAGADRALRDIDAITPVLLAQPFVDRSRVAVGGVSRGGILSVAWSGRQPDVPRAVVNFVGGWLGGRCWSASTSTKICSSAAPRTADDDLALRRQGPLLFVAHSRANFTAFREAGGKGTFHEYTPPEALDGHRIGSAPSLWSATLEAYLADQGLPTRAP